MELKEAKKIVAEFNEQNRYRDFGRINTAIKMVLAELEIMETNYETLQADVGQILKNLGISDDTIIADEFVSEVNKRYIPKSKITSMLKHYEECEEMYGNLHGSDTYSDGVVIDKICEVLRKLLEEE